MTWQPAPAAPPLCDYCGEPAVLTDGAVLYPDKPHMAGVPFWACMPCQAWAGCHVAGTWEIDHAGDKIVHQGREPLGRLANPDLRRAKHRAHAAFDPLWRGPNAPMTKRAAYAWLSAALGIPPEWCHVNRFDVAQCKAMAAAATAYRTANPIPGQPTRKIR